MSLRAWIHLTSITVLQEGKVGFSIQARALLLLALLGHNTFTLPLRNMICHSNYRGAMSMLIRACIDIDESTLRPRILDVLDHVTILVNEW